MPGGQQCFSGDPTLDRAEICRLLVFIKQWVSLAFRTPPYPDSLRPHPLHASSTMSNTLDNLKDALKFFIEHCQGSVPKDHYAAQSWVMSGAHAFLLNGLISIYEVRYFVSFP